MSLRPILPRLVLAVLLLAAIAWAIGSSIIVKGVGHRADWLPGTATVLAIVLPYGTAMAVTLLSLLGVSLAIDERAWAGVTTLFAALAAFAIALRSQHHRKVGPTVLAGLGLALILWVIYGTYSRVVELAGFALLAGATVWDWRVRASRKDTGTAVSWVEAETLAARLHEEPTPIIVDVRSPEEFADELGHLQGARNLPLGDLAQWIGELVPFKEREMILVCRTQMRSARGAAALTNTGFRNVAVLRGGMERWNQNGLPVEDRTVPGRT